MISRPMFLNLFQIKFPPMAIVSILHRISGVLIFLALPFWLYILGCSLASPEGLEHARYLLICPWCAIVAWVSLCAVFFHFIAGLRHLLMDLGFGETLCAGRASAYFVFLIFIVVAVLTGVWVW